MTVFQRAKGWAAEVLTASKDALALPSLGFTLSLASVYEGVPVKAPPGLPPTAP